LNPVRKNDLKIQIWMFDESKFEERCLFGHKSDQDKPPRNLETASSNTHGGEYQAKDLMCYQGFTNPLCGTNNLNDPERATYFYQKEQTQLTRSRRAVALEPPRATNKHKATRSQPESIRTVFCTPESEKT